MKEDTEKIPGIVFDIKRYAIHDGPGIRTTVFLKGCPLRCFWCDNPESQTPQPEIVWFKDSCIDCLKCVEICPANALKSDDRGNRILWQNACTLCGKCLEVCYAEAWHQIGRSMTVEEVLKEIEKDLIFYTLSEGGVTVSGGEPLLQWRFVREIFRACRERNIHTALYTCGYSSWKVLKKVLKFIDLVLFDIKVIALEKHLKYTAASNRVILENARHIDREGVAMRIRMPIITGYNDSEEDIRQAAEFIKGLRNVEGVDLLPYHRLGVPKYYRLGRQYKLEACQTPIKEHLQRIKRSIEAYGLSVFIYG